MILLNILRTLIATVFVFLYVMTVTLMPSLGWESKVFLGIPFYFLGNLLYDFVESTIVEAMNG